MEKPTLKRVEDFRKALTDYKMSDHGRDILASTNIVYLRGPSGAGRNTIIDSLTETGLYEFLVSDTTRPPRLNDGVMEEDGKQYWFRTEDEILEDIQAGLFVEAEIIHEQQVSGVSIRDLEKKMNDGKICAIEGHFEGADNFARLKPDTHLIYITPPSYEEWHKRLTKRGGMGEAELKQRFKTGLLDYRHGLKNDYFTYVVNDDFDECVADVRSVVETKDYPDEKNQAAKQACQDILDRILAEHGE